MQEAVGQVDKEEKETPGNNLRLKSLEGAHPGHPKAPLLHTPLRFSSTAFQMPPLTKPHFGKGTHTRLKQSTYEFWVFMLQNPEAVRPRPPHSLSNHQYLGLRNPYGNDP